jgi:hypothetical protein
MWFVYDPAAGALTPALPPGLLSKILQIPGLVRCAGLPRINSGVTNGPKQIACRLSTSIL